MAIKKRPPRPALDDAAIEAFGKAADTPAEPVASPPAPEPEKLRAAAPATRQGSTPAAAPEWPAGISKTFLLRYPDPSIPVAIEELQDLVGRNKHQTILLALRRGVEVLRREAEELGDRADLIK